MSRPGTLTTGPRIVYVGIGSNLEDPVHQVTGALAALAGHRAFDLLGRSRLYGNPPVGPVPQPDFVNAVAVLGTRLAPRETLDALLGIEAALGRVRGALRWGPRVIDLDLLVHGDRVVDEPGLEVPHPRIAERAFVLVPLAEVAPGLIVPRLGPIEALLARVDASALVPLDESRPEDASVAAGGG